MKKDSVPSLSSHRVPFATLFFTRKPPSPCERGPGEKKKFISKLQTLIPHFFLLSRLRGEVQFPEEVHFEDRGLSLPPIMGYPSIEAYLIL